MKSLFFTILLCLIFFTGIPSFAQSNYVPGYVITSAGDTLQGYLDSRGDARNSTLIKFKHDQESSSTTYKPTDLLSYYAGEKRYVSKEIGFKNEKNDKIINQVWVFLEVVVDGKGKLYAYKDYSDEFRFFANKDTSSLYELIGGEETITVNGQLRLRKKKQYLGILNFLFQDCAEININSLKKYDFTIRELAKIVTLYNTCANPQKAEIRQDKDNKKTRITTTFLVGVNKSTVKTDGYLNYLPNADTKLKPMAGVSFNVFTPSLNDKISFQLDLLYSNKGATSQDTRITFDLKYLDLGLMVKYHYPKGLIRPFVGVGAMYGLILNKKHAFTSDRKTQPTFLETLNSNEIGFCGEAGIAVPIAGKFVTLGYRYERAMITFNLASQSYHNIVNQFRIGYTF